MPRTPGNRSGNTENPADEGTEQDEGQSTDFGSRQSPSRSSFDEPTGDDAVSNPVIINR